MDRGRFFYSTVGWIAAMFGLEKAKDAVVGPTWDGVIVDDPTNWSVQQNPTTWTEGAYVTHTVPSDPGTTL